MLGIIDRLSNTSKGIGLVLLCHMVAKEERDLFFDFAYDLTYLKGIFISNLLAQTI